jgi:glutamine amidotransferase
LIDADMSIDFAQYTTPEDRVAVIATQPLTDNEVWTAFAAGDLLMFQDGEVTARTHIPVPPSVLEKARNPACDPSASVSMRAPLAASGADTDDIAAFES